MALASKTNLYRKPTGENSGRLIRLLPYLLISAFFLLLIVPLVFKTNLTVFDANDETTYHYRTITDFVREYPALNLGDYHSATTPLYHLVFMAIALVIGPGLIPLRLINAGISLACVLFLFAWLSRRGGKLPAAFFSLLVLLSPYFIGPAVRLSTDNAAFFLALLSIFSLEAGNYGIGGALGSNLLILATVLTRQLYAWLIGAYLVCGALYLRAKRRLQAGPLLAMALPALVPTLALGAFILLWHGLTPPRYIVHEAQNLNLNAPIYIVALIGLYGSFFAVPLWRILRQQRDTWIAAVLLACAGGLALIAHPVAVQSAEEAGGGALWSAAAHLPNLGHTSILYWVLFPLGLVYIYLLGAELLRRKELVLPVAFVLWLGTMAVSSRTFQKYYDPFILFSLGYALVPAEWKKWYEWAGPAVLILGFAAIAVYRFYL